MKKTLLAIFLVLGFCAVAQNQEPRKKKFNDVSVSIKPYGFVRTYLNVDSRKTVTVCGGDYNMIPYDEDWSRGKDDASSLLGVTLPEGGELLYDRNAVAQAQLQALSSRFGVALSGPQLLGAELTGRLEGDFAGFGTTNTVLRLRLAYVKMDWLKDEHRHSLLVGQDWHPLGGDIMPEAIGMAAGAPFRPHSRTPQIRYEFEHNGMILTAAALYQYQFTSPGPNGENTSYANQSIIPEFFVGAGYRGEHLYTQLGLGYNMLTVREQLDLSVIGGVSGQSFLFKGHCHSLSPLFYIQYTKNRFSLKMRSTLAQNLGHLNMLTGYARVVDEDDPSQWLYKPLTASISYLDIAYGHTWRVNLLLGYQKNFGLADGYTIVGDALFMKKGIKNIDDIWRIAPSVSFNTKAFNIGVEYELTGVGYGDLLPDGSVAHNDNFHQVINHRLCLMVKYNF